MKKRIIEISTLDRSETMQLVVNPSVIDFTDVQNNQKAILLDVGEVNLIGSRNLITVSLQSFFPSVNSPFYKRYGGRRSPVECKALIKKWKDNGTIIRLIISDMDINIAVTIDAFNTTLHEGDDDVNYTINLTEYKTLNVPTVKVSTQVKSTIIRPSTRAVSSQANSGRTHTVKKGDTLWAIAVKYYKAGGKYKNIYNANKSVIEDTAKKRGKKSSNNGHWIYPGTKLVIP